MTVTTLLQRTRKVYGVAVIEDFGIAETRVTGSEPDLLFQAGSIAKPVTALAALELAAHGQADLDADVNEQLTSWHMPGPQRISLRRLLGHTSGLGVPFFPGRRKAPRCRPCARSSTASRRRQRPRSEPTRRPTAGSAIPAADTPSSSN